MAPENAGASFPRSAHPRCSGVAKGLKAERLPAPSLLVSSKMASHHFDQVLAPARHSAGRYELEGVLFTLIGLPSMGRPTDQPAASCEEPARVLGWFRAASRLP